MTHLFIDRLGNYGDLEAIVEEMGAIYDKKTLLHMYHEAISEPYINLMQKGRNKMFMQRFDHYLSPTMFYSNI